MKSSASNATRRLRAVMAGLVGLVMATTALALAGAQAPDGPEVDANEPLLRNATVEQGRLQAVTVEQSDLSNLSLVNAEVRDTILEDVNVTGSTVQGSLVEGGVANETTLAESKATGTRFVNATLQAATVCQDGDPQGQRQRVQQQDDLFATDGAAQNQEGDNLTQNVTDAVGGLTFEDFLQDNETLQAANVTADEVECVLVSMDRGGEPQVQAFLLRDAPGNTRAGDSFTVELVAPEAGTLNLTASLLGPLSEVQEDEEVVVDANLTDANVTDANVTRVTEPSDLIESVQVTVGNRTLGTFNASEDIRLENVTNETITVQVNLTDQASVDQLLEAQQPVRRARLLVAIGLDGAPLLVGPINLDGPGAAPGTPPGQLVRPSVGRPVTTTTTTTAGTL